MELHDTAQRPEGGAVALSPITLRGLTLKNRLMVSPMCMYSAKDGMLDDFHLVHLGRFALGGAGLVFVEATAVTEQGRITVGCSGLWNDEQITPLKRIADFLHRFDCAAGIQLSHAGHKSSSQRPWEGGGPLGSTDFEARGDLSWETVGASAKPFDAGWPTPAEMSLDEIGSVRDAFAAAAGRADEAGVDVIELHAAHGYLLHSFLSPLSNLRTDRYGGDRDARMRFPLEVAAAVRAVWPERKPLFMRISSVDGIEVGWSVEDSIVLANRLKEVGVDAIDCSSGGMKLEKHQNLLQREPGFHLPYAERIKAETGIPTVAVGLIRDAGQAEAILADGKADLVAVAREVLFNPNWPAQVALALTEERGWSAWPEQFGWWLMRRARQQKDRFGSLLAGSSPQSAAGEGAKR